jgi:UDP-2-acetamido-2,6-beta-L-arabino-hexul-4-ose reductase
MNVLVAGNNQFIINNLYSYVQNYKNISLFNAKSTSQLIVQLKKSDVIILCFDLNRSAKIKDQLNQICKEIRGIKKKIPILCLSEYFDQNYLNIKLRVQENILLNLFNINNNPITIIRSPFIFGKWCNLNNSNLSKIICEKISKKSLLLKKKKKEKMIYVEDLINFMIKEINFLRKGFNFKMPNPIYSFSFKDIYEKIIFFKKNFSTINISKVGNGFERALYSTFLSYLSPLYFKNKIITHKDKRGEFIELIKTEDSGQFSFFTIRPGHTRGEHFHNTKFEKFLVIEGKVEFKFQHLLNKKIYKIFSSHKNLIIINTIPGWIHSLKNVGKKKALLFVWSNEIFDIKKPDTIFRKITHEKT